MPKIECLYAEIVSLDKLRPHPKNPNRHTPEQIKRLAKLIDAHGWRHPIIVSNLSGFIVAGHARLEAAEHLGLRDAPVEFQDFKDDAAEYQFLVADNAIAEFWSETDLAAVNLEIGDFGPDFDLDLLGIKDFTVDVAEKLPYGGDPDDAPAVCAEAKSKLGDLWTLGRHRLLCGDATDVVAIDRLIESSKVDMVFTDPPYGMNLDTNFEAMHASNMAGSRTNRPVIGDDVDYDPNPIFAIKADEVFIWGADYFCQKIPPGGSWVVWDKRESENMDRVHGASFELCWSKQRHKKLIYRKLWSGFRGMREDDGRRVHPTQKPVELVIWFLEQWGSAGDHVVDLYGGSGTTLIACEKTDRTCFMMELDPRYIDVILTRWAKYTGEDPVRDDGVKWSELSG